MIQQSDTPTIPEQLLKKTPLYYGDYLYVQEIRYHLSPGSNRLESGFFHQYRIIEQGGTGNWSSNEIAPDLKKGFDDALRNSATATLFTPKKREIFYPYTHKQVDLSAPPLNRENLRYFQRLFQQCRRQWRRYGVTCSGEVIYRAYQVINTSGTIVKQNRTTLSYQLSGRYLQIKDHIPLTRLSKKLLPHPKMAIRKPPEEIPNLLLSPRTVASLLIDTIKQGKSPLLIPETHPALADGLQSSLFDHEGSRRERFPLTQFTPGNIFTKKSHGNTFYNIKKGLFEHHLPDLVIPRGTVPIGPLLDNALIIDQGEQFEIDGGLLRFTANLIHYKNQYPRTIFRNKISIPVKQLYKKILTKEREISGFKHNSVKVPHLILQSEIL